MRLQAFSAILIAFLACGCHSVHSADSLSTLHEPDVSAVDVDVEVRELPGLFQIIE